VLRRCLRWLLQLDRPRPTWSESERLAYQARWLRWNLVFNITEGAAWWLGMSFASATTILPLFVSKLTPHKLPLAVLAAVASSGWALPQIFCANYAERMVSKKAMVVNFGLFAERLPACLWPAAALLAGSSPPLALVTFLVAHAWLCLGGGVIAPAWTDLVARCFPVDLRGRMFGFMVVLGSGLGIGGAKLSGHLIEVYPFPYNFAACFALAASGVMLSWALLAFTREPVSAELAPRQTHREFFTTLPALLRSDANLRGFLVSRVLTVSGGLGSGFLMVSATSRWQVPDAMAGDYTAAMMVGQVIGNLLCGVMSDRHGHKITLQSGVACSALAYAIAAAAPSAGWYYSVFLLLGIAGGAFFVSGILMILELASPERRPTYVGLVNTSLGAMGIVSPLVGAALAEVGFGWLFAVGAVLQTAGLVVLTLAVRDPRRGGLQPTA